MDNNYDLVIIGSGPAGLTASIYASRYKLSHLVIGKALGGELSLAHKIDNYPGFKGISGMELGEKWKKQVEDLGGKILLKEVKKVEAVPGLQGQKRGFKVYLDNEEIYYSQALIAATGSERRRLNIPGEKEYLGKGVSYCTVCDAPFFRGRTVVLVGGADAAVSGAVHTAEYAEKVYLIYRRDKLRAEPSWITEWQKLEQNGKGVTIYNTNVSQILGGPEFAKVKKGEPGLEQKDQVVALKLDRPYNGSEFLLSDGIFIEVGGVPGTSLVQSLGAKIDEQGYVIVDDEMKTNVEGLFCAGDVVNKSAGFKQAIWAMGQGARAAASAYRFIKNENTPSIRGI